jgi:glutathione S-transferase
MAQAKTLHVCHIDRGGPKPHPCRKVHETMDELGSSYETNVFDKNRPMGWFTKGKRPDLKEMTGQEKLPVLELDDGTMISPSRKIIEWAKQNAPSAAPAGSRSA